jgi:hypothetical protein
MGRVICVFVCVLPVLILMSDGVTAAEVLSEVSQRSGAQCGVVAAGFDG